MDGLIYVKKSDTGFVVQRKDAVGRITSLRTSITWMSFYWLILVRPLFWITARLSAFDKSIVDGFVNGVGYVTLAFSEIYAFFDKWVIDGAVNLVGIFTRLSGRLLSYAQTGSVQNYLLVVFTGVLAIAVIFLYR